MAVDLGGRSYALVATARPVRPFAFATAAESSYFKALWNFVGSVHANNPAHVIVNDLGLTESEVSF
jgi:hypothetical protein